MSNEDGEDRYPVLAEELEIALAKLEFADILELIACDARSERAARHIRATGPLGLREEIERSQGEILELFMLGEAGEDLSLSGWTDSMDILAGINAEGATASSEELARIAAAERAARSAVRFLSAREEQLPLLSNYRKTLSINEELIRSITEIIGPDLEVVDGASRELVRIRRETRRLRDRLRKEFADFAARHGEGKGFEFVTVRGQRYVVSLPRRDAARIDGIVHQASGSGASLYVEPMEFIRDNNRLESLVQDETAEIERILRDLTHKVFLNREALMGNQETIVMLDAIGAKARFALRFKCTQPCHSSDGTLVLRNARHPLLERQLDGKAVIPLDIECRPDCKVVVISGPNAGGKTIALKTIGLLVMMDGAGFLLPCGEGTIIPGYDSVFVDIGDDQSIERSLSTFSSKIVRLKNIIKLAGERSLILIDEIGDGTDPAEGAALAEAVLDHLVERCGLVVVTTHLTSLKGWAHGKPGAVNATLEFDAEMLEPLFKLRLGVPGRSWGIEMAGRLGLDSEIVERAKGRTQDHVLRLEELLAHLEKMEGFVSREREELVNKERELSGLIESYRDRIEVFRKNRDSLEQQARKEALEIVSSTRREMEHIIREIRMTQAERETIRKAKERVGELKTEFERKIRRKPEAVPIRPELLETGLWVEIISLGKNAKIISCDNPSKVKLELEGGMRVETKVGDLAPGSKVCRPDSVRMATWNAGRFEPVMGELMVRGLEREEALERVDAYIDRAVLQGLQTVTIIHGIGKGILKRAIYRMLNEDSRVSEVHPGQPAAGGDGVAIVKLK